jgi:hypothetical protein
MNGTAGGVRFPYLRSTMVKADMVRAVLCHPHDTLIRHTALPPPTCSLQSILWSPRVSFFFLRKASLLIVSLPHSRTAPHISHPHVLFPPPLFPIRQIVPAAACVGSAARLERRWVCAMLGKGGGQRWMRGRMSSLLEAAVRAAGRSTRRTRRSSRRSGTKGQRDGRNPCRPLPLSFCGGEKAATLTVPHKSPSFGTSSLLRYGDHIETT